MKQLQKRLKRKTVFVFRSMQKDHVNSTDPTTTSIIIISTGTRIHPAP